MSNLILNVANTLSLLPNPRLLFNANAYINIHNLTLGSNVSDVCCHEFRANYGANKSGHCRPKQVNEIIDNYFYNVDKRSAKRSPDFIETLLIDKFLSCK
ncbi:hypothetical protein PUN28_017156 [Cardiocondyla obscurior]|uniref:Uncharacterized protein n=1 Tax=Cardiocondyla obscurior TaxID=286306 RepID=A0AAW2ELT3_9HYME